MELNSVNSIYLDNEIFSYKKYSHRDFSCFQFHYLHYTIQTETSPCKQRIEFALSSNGLNDLIVYYSIKILNRTQVYLPKSLKSLSKYCKWLENRIFSLI